MSFDHTSFNIKVKWIKAKRILSSRIISQLNLFHRYIYHDFLELQQVLLNIISFNVILLEHWWDAIGTYNSCLYQLAYCKIGFVMCCFT